MSLIELKNVKKAYPVGENELYYALKGIDLQVNKGEFVTIMGPSGSGKSTMLHILGCLDVPTSGKYILNKNDVGEKNDDELSKIRNEEIGFIFQSFNLLPKISVIDNVTLPFIYSNVPSSERKQIAVDALKSVGLGDKLENKPNQLSGGQVQRVAIARSLVLNPSIILADEPTGNLDTKTSEQILDILTGIHEDGATIILITHEPEIAKFGSRTVILKDGLIVDNDFDVSEAAAVSVYD